MRGRLALGMLVVVVGCAASSTRPPLGERIATRCATVESCEALLSELKAERAECQVGRLPADCEQRELDYALLKRHVRERKNHLRAQAEQRAVEEGLAEREAARASLSTEHAKLKEAEAKKQAAKLEAEEAAWAALDPKRCALEGDRASCYEIVQFLAKAPDSPHRAEAEAALAAGQKLLAETPGDAPAPEPSP